LNGNLSVDFFCLVKAVQELSKINNDKTSTIDSLKKNNQDLNSKVDALADEVTQLKNLVYLFSKNRNKGQQYRVDLSNAASLEQNVPNPFASTTTIAYNLPQKFSSAQIIITDKNGKSLKQLTLSGACKGNINVNASTLAAGAYTYSLHVDGKLIDSKQMGLLK
jgi:trimeric autotransporter adhesin